MSETFDYTRRSAELIEQGLSDDELVAELDGEQEKADFIDLNDGAWFSQLNDIVDGAEERYQAYLASEEA